MQNYSLHTHTKGFDGSNTVDEMVASAKELGWSRIGISNHFIVYPDIERTRMYKFAERLGYSAIYSTSFDEAVQKIQDNFDEIDRVRDETGFTIYKAIEADFFNTVEWKVGFEDACRKLKPDYVIASAHYVEYDGTLMNMHDMVHLSDEHKDAIVCRYWNNIRQAVTYGNFDFMAHLDLLKRCGLGTEERWMDEEAKTVDLIAESKMPVEINTARMDKIGEPIPTLRMLKLLFQYNIPLFLSDDAHSAAKLEQNYEKVENLLSQNNLSLPTQPVVKAKRSPVPLNEVIARGRQREG